VATYTGAPRSYPGSCRSARGRMQIDESAAQGGFDLAARLGGMAYPRSRRARARPPVLTTGSVLVVSAEHMDISFDYFVVIETLP